MKGMLLCVLLLAGCATPERTPVRFSTDLLFYNRDWFDNAREPMPDESWNWQKFGDVADRLARQRDLNFAAVLPRALLLVQSYGATLFTNGQCKIDSPETVAGLVGRILTSASRTSVLCEEACSMGAAVAVTSTLERWACGLKVRVI